MSLWHPQRQWPLYTTFSRHSRNTYSMMKRENYVWKLDIFRIMFWKFKRENMSSDLRPFEFISCFLYQALSCIDITNCYFAHFKYSSFFLVTCKVFTEDPVWDASPVCSKMIRKAAFFMSCSKGSPRLILNVVPVTWGDTSPEAWVFLLNEYSWHVLIYANIHAYI